MIVDLGTQWESFLYHFWGIAQIWALGTLRKSSPEDAVLF